MLRKLIIAGFLVAAIGAVKAGYDTMRDPVIERVAITSDELPVGSEPLTIAFLTDIHVAGPDMPPSRLERIVEQVNALEPDLIAIAGDLVSEKRTATHIYSPEEVVTPLGNLQAKLGVVIAPGNHDHWYDWPALSAEIAKHPNLTVLANDAAQFGPLAVGGADDAFTGRDDLEATFGAMAPLTGARIVVTHSPDIFPQVPVDVDLTLAGHTHCGQIVYPWGGSPATMSDYGELYACGVYEQHGKTLVTSAGLGTSLLPIRLFTHPEVWLIEMRPPPS
ncbi:metallophosphoesterase [Erythrobacter sp. F6033]|uniref:metallophosphoesterase n=1 Tax=Erythrobacter sp. F6033 TaxID=2926401 RepID=UPI001FF2E5A6|nr:metallophosphoesterase [Erythrobacter sp. F6033]MCK0128707.1 metallophosphoesterase [Erythrobacter sp. F6033]